MFSKDYKFTGPTGTVTLADMFQGRDQLILYHAMFDPDWDTACKSCSFLIDQIPQHLEHLHVRNTTLVLVSRAPSKKLEAFKKRMGWTLDWFSSASSDFNYDFHVTMDEKVTPVEYNFKPAKELPGHHARGEQPGFSTFLKQGGEIYHSYSCYGRGPDHLLTTYGKILLVIIPSETSTDYIPRSLGLLDLTPLGRQDPGKSSDGSGLGFQLHDEYNAA